MVVRSVMVIGLLVLAGLSLSASVVVGVTPAAVGIGPSPKPALTLTRVPAQALGRDAHRLDVPMHLPLPPQGSWEAFLQAMGS